MAELAANSFMDEVQYILVLLPEVRGEYGGDSKATSVIPYLPIILHPRNHPSPDRQVPEQLSVTSGRANPEHPGNPGRSDPDSEG